MDGHLGVSARSVIKNPSMRRPTISLSGHHLGRGFTLIELMIAVVVVGILASLAYPSFMGAIRKSRRSEAFTALSAIQQAQERWRGNNSSYAGSLTATPPAGLGLPSTTPGAHYAMSIANSGATTYEAIATANSGQSGDGNCAKLGVKMEGGNLKYRSAASSGSLDFSGSSTYQSNETCWSR
jgi:type IV pilus assembly protein PilE